MSDDVKRLVEFVFGKLGLKPMIAVFILTALEALALPVIYVAFAGTELFPLTDLQLKLWVGLFFGLLAFNGLNAFIGRLFSEARQMDFSRMKQIVAYMGPRYLLAQKALAEENPPRAVVLDHTTLSVKLLLPEQKAALLIELTEEATTLAKLQVSTSPVQLL